MYSFKLKQLACFCALAVAFFSSCNNTSEEAFKPVPVDHKLLIKDSKPEPKYDLRKIIDIQSVINIATDSTNYFASCSKIIPYKNYLYILDPKLSALRKYDMQGKFVANIGQIGEGPGEFRKIFDFDIDPRNGVLFLLDNIGTVISYQTSDCSFIRQKRMTFYANSLAIVGDKVVLYMKGKSNRGSYNILLTSIDQRVEQKLFPFQECEFLVRSSGIFQKQADGSILYANQFRDTIYRLVLNAQNQLKVTAPYKIEFEKNKFPENEDYCKAANEFFEKKYSFLLQDFTTEVDGNLMFLYSEQHILKLGMYNNGRLLISEDFDKNYMFYLNLKPVGMLDKETVIASLSPEDIPFFKDERKELFEEIKKDNINLYNAMQQNNGNPILVLFKLKKMQYEK